jgi:hypothetical protein
MTRASLNDSNTILPLTEKELKIESLKQQIQILLIQLAKLKLVTQ